MNLLIFFDDLTLVLDDIDNITGPDSVDITIVSPDDPALIRGFITHTNVRVAQPLYSGDYVIQLKEIEETWAEVEVMPLTRWFISPPSGEPE